jgi:hypothetical protein
MDLCVSLKVSPTRSDEQEQQQGIVVSRVAEKGDAVRMDLSMVTARLPKARSVSRERNLGKNPAGTVGLICIKKANLE